MSAKEVFSPGKYRRIVYARSLLCYWAVRELGISMASLSRRLHISSAAVSQSVRRGENLAKENHYQLIHKKEILRTSLTTIYVHIPTYQPFSDLPVVLFTKMLWNSRLVFEMSRISSNCEKSVIARLGEDSSRRSKVVAPQLTAHDLM